MTTKNQDLRAWGTPKSRCAECCNKDGCDDPTHFERSKCPHCKSTGYALWLLAGRDEFVKNQMAIGLSEREAVRALLVLVGDTPRR